MAVGMSQYLANKVFDAIGNNVSLAIAQGYIKLHVGDPGAAATANAAVETTRKAANFATAASGVMTSDGAATWTGVAGSERYTFYSVWDSATVGNFLWSGTVTAAAVLAGDTFILAIGNVNLAISLAA